VSARNGGVWNPEKVYEMFPRLAERRRHEGDQLSGGEQQMLAIGRALVANPRVLIMDEPSEGLAPLIVQQVEELLIRLAREEDWRCWWSRIWEWPWVARAFGVMVNGRIRDRTGLVSWPRTVPCKASSWG
jgi:ABC-type branched-subunit amino acid transport system ATPase component